jgi:hypothetical protein
MENSKREGTYPAPASGLLAKPQALPGVLALSLRRGGRKLNFIIDAGRERSEAIWPAFSGGEVAKLIHSQTEESWFAAASKYSGALSDRFRTMNPA